MRHSALLILATTALAVAGCDRKAEGQTVAVVNGEEITVPELNAEMQRANVPEGADKKEATSRILQSLVDRRLVAQQARKEGVDKSPEYITASRRADEELLISMYAGRKVKTSELPSESEIANFQASRPEMFAKREIWGLNQLAYATPTDKKILAAIAATKSLDQLESVLTANGIAVQKGKGQVNTGTLPKEVYARISSLPAGEPFLIPTGGKTIASSIAVRQPAPLVGDAAKPVAVEQMRRTQSATVITDQVKQLRSAAKIEYKEGFAPPPPAK